MKYVFALLAVLILFVSACEEEGKEVQGDVKVEDGIDVVQGEDAKSEFLNFVKNKDTSYKIRYKTLTTTPQESIEGEMTQYIDGKNFRFDTTVEQGGMKTESRAYFIDRKGYVCMKQEQNFMCFVTGEVPKEEIEKTDIEANLPPDFSVVKKGTKTIAGQVTTCYSVSGIGEDNLKFSEEVCINNKGAVFYMEMKSKDFSIKMEAIDYSDTVTSSDFQLPAQPQELPNFQPPPIPSS